MKINIFKPFKYKKANLNIEYLNDITGRNWIYAANGKSALYHCLNSLDVKGCILLPIYICKSILVPIRKLGIIPYFYDINESDLNPSLTDIKKKILQYKPSCILVASMYGNPAELENIESLCKKQNVLLIDDAAQSFGSKINNNRYVGTFGNAGFFSFSPGKPTSGHMGAFFWTENKDYSIKRTKHPFFHYLKYLDFYFNRYKIYEFEKYKIFKILTYLTNYLNKNIDYTNDSICNFEKKILGGIIDNNFKQTFRKIFFSNHKHILEANPHYKLITKGNIGTNNHKLVLLFLNERYLDIYKNQLRIKNIYFNSGYLLLSNNSNTPNANTLKNLIIEIPIEDDINKMNYLINSLYDINEITKIQIK